VVVAKLFQLPLQAELDNDVAMGGIGMGLAQDLPGIFVEYGFMIVFWCVVSHMGMQDVAGDAPYPAEEGCVVTQTVNLQDDLGQGFVHQIFGHGFVLAVAHKKTRQGVPEQVVKLPCRLFCGNPALLKARG